MLRSAGLPDPRLGSFDLGVVVFWHFLFNLLFVAQIATAQMVELDSTRFEWIQRINLNTPHTVGYEQHPCLDGSLLVFWYTNFYEPDNPWLNDSYAAVIAPDGTMVIPDQTLGQLPAAESISSVNSQNQLVTFDLEYVSVSHSSYVQAADINSWNLNTNEGTFDDRHTTTLFETSDSTYVYSLMARLKSNEDRILLTAPYSIYSGENLLVGGHKFWLFDVNTLEIIAEDTLHTDQGNHPTISIPYEAGFILLEAHNVLRIDHDGQIVWQHTREPIAWNAFQHDQYIDIIDDRLVYLDTHNGSDRLIWNVLDAATGDSLNWTVVAEDIDYPTRAAIFRNGNEYQLVTDCRSSGTPLMRFLRINSWGELLQEPTSTGICSLGGQFVDVGRVFTRVAEDQNQIHTFGTDNENWFLQDVFSLPGSYYVSHSRPVIIEDQIMGAFSEFDETENDIILGAYRCRENTSQQKEMAVPASFLAKAYPNPTNGGIQLEFVLTQPSDISIRLFNVAGRLCQSKDLVSQPAGDNRVGLSLSDLSSGLYFIEIETSIGFSKMLKILHVK